MRIVAKKNLAQYAAKHPQAKSSLLDWYEKTKAADWQTATDVRNTFNTADNIGGDRFVFNINGNHYRLVAAINFNIGAVFLKFIGTHAEYDKTDVHTINQF
jgi:mRNA interferase HigB